MSVWLIAQNLLEYGMLASFARGLTRAEYALEDWFRRQQYPRLLIAGAAIVLLAIVVQSFRPRGRRELIPRTWDLYGTDRHRTIAAARIVAAPRGFSSVLSTGLGRDGAM